MKTSKHHLYGLITVLFIVGLSLFFYRHLVLGVPFTDHENVNSWVVEANLKLGFGMDERDYGIGAQILKDLSIRKMKLLAKLGKLPTMAGYDLEVTGHLPYKE